MMRILPPWKVTVGSNEIRLQRVSGWGEWSRFCVAIVTPRQHLAMYDSTPNMVVCAQWWGQGNLTFD